MAEKKEDFCTAFIEFKQNNNSNNNKKIDNIDNNQKKKRKTKKEKYCQPCKKNGWFISTFICVILNFRSFGVVDFSLM